MLEYLQRLGNFNICTLREPLNKWTELHGTNLLMKHYQDPHVWSHSFQSLAMLTMADNHIERIASNVKIMERSIFSGRYCFLERHRR